MLSSDNLDFSKSSWFKRSYPKNVYDQFLMKGIGDVIQLETDGGTDMTVSMLLQKSFEEQKGPWAFCC
jgi:hypothetical protein